MNYQTLGIYSGNKGGLKSWDCGCMLRDSMLEPQVLPCCFEHQGLLLKQVGEGQEIRLRFGKHKGKTFAEVPEDYLEWLLSSDKTEEPLRTQVDTFLNDPSRNFA